jgi:uncharacterized membrane protein YdbT with pleckstrin-like domain
VAANTEAARPAPGSTAEGPPAPIQRLTPQGDQSEAPASDDAERQIWEGGYSPRAMAGPAVAMILLTLVAVVGAVYVGVEATVWVILSVGIVIGWLGLYLVLLYRKMSVRYFLSTQRFIHQAGILRRVTDRIEVIDIDDITVQQGFVERLLRVGTICIASSDRTHPELRLRGIANANEIASTMDNIRRSERRKRGLHIEAI